MVKALGGRLYYGWVVVAVVFLALLVSAGVRAAPAVLINPLETELGWSRAAISFAVSVGLLLYALSGPVAGWLMDRFGPTRLTLVGLAVIAGWREGTVLLAVAVFLILVPVLLFMRDDPTRLGLRPYGARESEERGTAAEESPAPEPGTAAEAPAEARGGAVSRALRTPEFWLLSGSFFICGASSNGIIGVHFLPHSIDHGIPEVTDASVLALMGAMNFVGTIASGWLTDRYDPRKLLAVYYSLRGLSLLLLPFVTEFAGLAVFAVFFGLDYIATVPPTVALVADRFGRMNVGAVFGWVFFSHQVGAALASYLGGVARDSLGDYTAAFLAAGILAILAALMASRITREPLPPVPAGSRP